MSPSTLIIPTWINQYTKWWGVYFLPLLVSLMNHWVFSMISSGFKPPPQHEPNSMPSTIINKLSAIINPCQPSSAITCHQQQLFINHVWIWSTSKPCQSSAITILSVLEQSARRSVISKSQNHQPIIKHQPAPVQVIIKYRHQTSIDLIVLIYCSQIQYWPSSSMIVG